MSRRVMTDVLDSITKLLSHGSAHTQKELVEALNRHGFQVSQPQVSRYLRKLNAIKVKKADNKTVYQLPGEMAPPTMDLSLHHYTLSIDHSDTMVIIRTIPGAAAIIARLIDHNLDQAHALGVVAGDDTLFVAPQRGISPSCCAEAIRGVLHRSHMQDIRESA